MYKKIIATLLFVILISNESCLSAAQSASASHISSSAWDYLTRWSQPVSAWLSRNKAAVGASLAALACIYLYRCRQQSASAPQALVSTTYNMLNTNKTLTIVQGDITTQPVDMIVNAANDALACGGGVCGAIFKASRDPEQLQKDCDAFPIVQARSLYDLSKPQRCPPGESRITKSYYGDTNPIKYIVHAVGPTWDNFSKNKHSQLAGANLLSKTYTFALTLALTEQPQLHSIAFPLISSLRFGFTNINDPSSLQNPIVPAIDGILRYTRQQQENPMGPIDIRIIVQDKGIYNTINNYIKNNRGHLFTQQP